MRYFLLLLSLVCSLCTFNKAHSAEDLNVIAPHRMAVSLGSWCESAWLTVYAGSRVRAFPLDWVVSHDIEKLIEVLDFDFDRFLDDNYLYINHEGLPHQTLYHIQFRHDGNYAHGSWEASKEQFKQKYARRIARFQALENYRGKVYFVRCSNPLSDMERSLFWGFPENVYISDHNAQRLRDAIRRRFPELDFALIIMNCHAPHSVVFEKRLDSEIFFYEGQSFYEF